jgi:hypothetical protein
MTSNGRVARLTALALATGTLVAAGSGTAGAATTNTDVFKALGGGSVLRLTVNLPIEVPGIGQTLTQDLVLTGGNTLSGVAPAAIANSVLGANGTVPLISDLIEKSVTAEYGTPAPASVNAFPSQLAALGIKGELLALTSSVANPNVDGIISSGHSAVADLRIEGAGNLGALIDALTSQLTAILDNALGALPSGAAAPSVAGVTSQVPVTQLLGSLTAALPQIAQDALGTTQLTQQVQDALDSLVAQLDALPKAIAAQLKARTADTSLLHVGLIESKETVTRKAGVVTSDVKNVLTDISALGGLITIEGLSSQASAALGNGVSKAAPKAVGSSSLLKVNAADLLTVDVTSGLDVILGGNVLPQEVKDAVNGALAQITTLLNGVLGATLTGPKVDENVTSENRAASSVSAAHFVVNPALPGVGPIFDKPLIDISLVPARAEVVKGQAAVPPTVVNTPSSRETLPRTGAELPLTGAVAVAMMGLAVVARRRRMAHLG